MATVGRTTLTTAPTNLETQPSAARTPAPTWTAMAGPTWTMRSLKTQPSGRTPTAMATAITAKAPRPTIAPRLPAPLHSTASAVSTRTAMGTPTPTACGTPNRAPMPSSMMQPNGRTLTATATATITPTILGPTETRRGPANTEPTWCFKTLVQLKKVRRGRTASSDARTKTATDGTTSRTPSPTTPHSGRTWTETGTATTPRERTPTSALRLRAPPPSTGLAVKTRTVTVILTQTPTRTGCPNRAPMPSPTSPRNGPTKTRTSTATTQPATVRMTAPPSEAPQPLTDWAVKTATATAFRTPRTRGRWLKGPTPAR